MNLTIHRGSKEIGGSCVELRAGDSRIVLDIGMPLVKPDGGSFDIREYDGLTGSELVERAVLPRVQGLYSWQKPLIDAVLISHAHPDHYGFLSYVHRDIPVYLSTGTLKLIEITALVSGKKSPLKSTLCFSWPSRFRIGPFTVIPHLVDHSAFSAFAFEIEANGKRIVYSGDFRGHGYLGKAMDVLYKKVRPGMDGLLMEGTTLGRTRERAQTETELAAEAATLFKKTEKAVFVYQSGQNISRAVSFFKAAASAKRYFVPDIYTAHVMRELGHSQGGEGLPWPGKRGFDSIKVWYPKRISAHLKRMGHTEILEGFRAQEVRSEDISKDPAKYVVLIRPGMESDLSGMQRIEGSVLIYSLWDGYRASEKTRRFLETAESLGVRIQTLHTSGHAELLSLQRMVDTLNPRQLIPIHTFHPRQFSASFNRSALALQDGQEIVL